MGLQSLEVTLVQWHMLKVRKYMVGMLSDFLLNSYVDNSDSDLSGPDITYKLLKSVKL